MHEGEGGVQTGGPHLWPSEVLTTTGRRPPRAREEPWRPRGLITELLHLELEESCESLCVFIYMCMRVSECMSE